MCFDLISLSFLQVGFCFVSVGTFCGFVLLFIFLITQPDTGIHFPIFDHFLEGSSTPALPEGNNRASAAQHLSSGDKLHLVGLYKLFGIHICTGTSCQLQGTDTKSLTFSGFLGTEVIVFPQVTPLQFLKCICGQNFIP